MTHVTCRLTAKNRDQLRNPTLGNRVWSSFTFTCYRGCAASSQTRRGCNIDVVVRTKPKCRIPLAFHSGAARLDPGSYRRTDGWTQCGGLRTMHYTSFSAGSNRKSVIHARTLLGFGLYDPRLIDPLRPATPASNLIRSSFC